MVLTKIKYLLFILLLFMQNFALISTSDFGISGLVVYLLIFSFINFKDYYLHIKKSLLIVLIIVIIFLLGSCLINNSLVLTQILRNLMIIWLVYISNIFIKGIYVEGNDLGEFFHQSLFHHKYSNELITCYLSMCKKLN